METFQKMTIKSNLLKAGELARQAGVLVTTIRFYTKIGLLIPHSFSPGGYSLYSEDDALAVLKEINNLKRKRFTLDEIKEKLQVGAKRKRA